MDPEYSIRPAKEGDQARIYALLGGKDSTLSFDDPRHPLNETNAIIESSFDPDSKDRCWLAVAGNRPVGIITTDGKFNGGVFIDESHRGHGIGAALLLTREAFLVSRGETESQLSVLASNSAAIRCYKKIGYEFNETSTGAPEKKSGDPVLVMTKKLSGHVLG